MTAPPVPAPDTEQLADLEQPAGLFGAATTPGVFRPVPVVTLAGVTLAAGTGGAPLAGQVVLDDVAVSWGRSGMLEQPEPSTASLALFDATRRWALTRDLVGTLVLVSHQGVDPADGATVSRVFFRGRISTVTVTPRTVLDPSTGRPVDGALVSLQATSVLADLANITPMEAWPQETLGARRARIAAAATAAGISGGVLVRPYWEQPEVAAIPAGDSQSLYDRLVALFDSSGGDRLTYDPHLNRVQYLVRQDYPVVRSLSQLWRDVTGTAASARAGLGAYVRTWGATPAGGSSPTAPAYLDAHSLEYADDGLTKTMTDRLSRVVVRHPSSDPAWAGKDRTVELRVPGVDEVVSGVRALRHESIVLWNSFADQGAGDLAEIVSEEAARWRPGPARLVTGRVGGFESRDLAWFLLNGAEITRPVFLQRSWFPAFGQRPVFCIIGGSIAYRDLSWDLELELGGISATGSQHPITWEEIGSDSYRVEWHDVPHPLGLHESVTYEDLEHVGYGVGGTASPPDQGWDFYS